MTKRVLALVLSGGLLAGAASAQEPPEPVQIAYRAPADCADRATFVRAIQARTTRIADVDGSSATRTFAVELSEQEDGFKGELVGSDTAGNESTREFQGRSCNDVVAALALVVALTVDPEASIEPQAALESKQEPKPAPVTVRRERPREKLGSAQASLWKAGVHASLQTAVAPVPLPAFGALVEISRVAGAFEGVAVRLLAHHGFASDDTDAGGADIRWTVARLELCPVRWGGVRLAVRPCAGMEGGLLSVEGTRTANAEQVRRPWLAAALLGRVSWQLIELISVEPELGIFVPTFRGRYYLRPETTVHDIPAIGVTGGISVALSLM